MTQPIFENKIVRGGFAGRISNLVDSSDLAGTKASRSSWQKTIGEDNFNIALELGVISEVITENSLVSLHDVLKNGDYVVFQGGDEGHVMYHMADEQLWRTAGETVDDLVAENAKAVDGISLSDGSLQITMTGHDTPPQPVSDGLPRAIEIDPPEDFDNLDIEMPGMEEMPGEELPDEETPAEPEAMEELPPL